MPLGEHGGKVEGEGSRTSPFPGWKYFYYTTGNWNAPNVRDTSKPGREYMSRHSIHGHKFGRWQAVNWRQWCFVDNRVEATEMTRTYVDEGKQTVKYLEGRAEAAKHDRAG